MARVYIDGTSLEYVDRGNREPVVFVHGSYSDQRTWQRQRDEFGKRFRVVTYSRRYHWPNERIPDGSDYSMTEHVDDPQTLLRLLGTAPAHLVGHFYGAFLCLLLAIKQPALVRTLVLARYFQLILPKGATPEQYLRAVKRWGAVEDATLPPQASLP